MAAGSISFDVYFEANLQNVTNAKNKFTIKLVLRVIYSQTCPEDHLC